MASPRSRPRAAPVWLAVPIVAMALALAALFGWILQQRVAWLVHAPRLEGVVVDVVSRPGTSSGRAGTRPGTRLEVVTEVPDAGAPDGRTRFTTLAPMYYPFAAAGDRVAVFETAGRAGGDRFELAHPVHLAQPLLIVLLPLGFLFAIADAVLVPTSLRRHWRGAFAAALVLPLAGVLR